MDSSESEIQQAAKRKTNHIRVSTRIRSQSQLFWHQPDDTSEVHPCRTCEPDEALGLPNIPETWNEKREVLVQYIVYPNIGDMRLVSREELIPYHGHSSSNKKRKVQRANGTKIGGGGGNWCENLMERYRKQRAKQLRNGSIGSGGSGGGGKRKGRGKKGESPMHRNDIQVDVLVQMLYLEKVLESVRTQEVGSEQSSDSWSEHSMPDSSMGSASGGNWGSKITKKGSEDEQEERSWSQEFKSRVKSGQQKQTTGRKTGKSSYNTSTGSVSSSEDSSDDDVEALLQGDKRSISSNTSRSEKKKSNKRSYAMSSSDEEETEPTSFSQERNTRMKKQTGTVRSKARELESDSSSSNSDSDRRLQSKKKKAGAHATNNSQSNDSISMSSDSDNESEGDTSVTEEAPLQKKRNTNRLSKGRVSFGGISVHDDGDGENDADGSDDEDDDEHELLDIPYTQALGLESDDDYLPPPMLDPENAKSKEPIRPGDVIEYSSFLFVAGDKRGHREATVISVDPNREPVLVLDNGEVLPSDSTIRRTKILLGGKLCAHSGVSRPIQNFVLEKAVMEGRSDKISAGFAKEASRVGGIIRRNMTKFQEKAQAEGFAPMDMMNRYKGTNFDSNIGSAATSNKEKKKKAGLSPIKERWGRSHSGDVLTPSTGHSSRKKKSTHQSSQSSALSESSKSDSEEEQPRRSLANSKTKRSSSYQGKKKRTAASPVLDLSRSSSDDDDDGDDTFDSESPRPRATSTRNDTSIARRKDAVSSGSLSSSCDSEESDRDIGRTTKVSNKRKSLGTKKTPKRDVWDTSPRKKKSSATKKDKKRDILSFDSSDDDFEAKGRRRIITVSDKKKKKKKKPNQHSSNSSSKKKAKTKKTSSPSPSSPVIDLSSSDEKKQGGWLQSLGGGTKKSKTSHLSGRRKNTKDEGGAASSSFSLRRFK